jgi:anti-sigma factor RsiW
MTDHREDLTCRELAGFVADWVDGALAPDERARFDAHVAACPDCATYLRTYAQTIRLAKDAHADEPAPADVPEDLVRAILDARPRRR